MMHASIRWIDACMRCVDALMHACMHAANSMYSFMCKHASPCRRTHMRQCVFGAGVNTEEGLLFDAIDTAMESSPRKSRWQVPDVYKHYLCSCQHCAGVVVVDALSSALLEQAVMRHDSSYSNGCHAPYIVRQPLLGWVPARLYRCIGFLRSGSNSVCSQNSTDVCERNSCHHSHSQNHSYPPGPNKKKESTSLSSKHAASSPQSHQAAHRSTALTEMGPWVPACLYRCMGYSLSGVDLTSKQAFFCGLD